MATEHDIQVMLKLQSTLAAQVKQEEEKVKGSLNKMSESASLFGSTMTKVAGAVGVSLVAMKIVDITKNALEMGTAITQTSARMGMSTDSFQKWAHIAKESGAHMETLSRGFRTLAVKAEMNDPIFKKLGISTRDEHRALRDTSDIMQDVIERLSQIQNPTERLAVAQKLLGRAAGDAMQMAALGTVKFRDLAEESNQFKLTPEQLKSLNEANLSIERLGYSFKIAAGEIVAIFAPAISAVAKQLPEIVIGVGEFFTRTTQKTQEAKQKQLMLIAETINKGKDLIRQDQDQLVWLDHQKNKTQAQLDLIKILKIEIADTTKNIQEQSKKISDVASGRTDKGAKTGSDIDLSKKKAVKDNSKEILKTHEETSKILAQQNMADDERELADLKEKYSKMFQLTWKSGKETTDIVRAYNIERSEITRKQQQKNIEEERRVTKETEKLATTSYRHKLDAQKKYNVMILKGTKTGFIHVAIEYHKDKAEFDEMLHDKLITQDQYDSSLLKLQGDAYAGYAQIVSNSLGAIADATQANAQVKKRIAEGEAIISGGKAALGVIENSGQFIENFGPIAGPILMGVELAGIIAEAVVQVQKIESAKMRYGGIAVGGIQGQDSVPVMMEPGEIAYNPAHPNPALASIIGSTVTNNAGNIHINMGGAVVVQGSPSRFELKNIQDHIDKGVTRALKRAQNLGKITAPGLVIRN